MTGTSSAALRSLSLLQMRTADTHECCEGRSPCALSQQPSLRVKVAILPLIQMRPTVLSRWIWMSCAGYSARLGVYASSQRLDDGLPRVIRILVQYTLRNMKGR